ncbi:MAG: HAMP domain-containing protein, partial [Anaerolineae bacterium]|nr:HAMP domain-containing protein [Anaerolineae bacterium]
MFKKMSLHWKMVILITMTSLMVLATMSIISYSVTANIVKSRIAMHMRTETLAIANDVNTFFARIGQIPVTIGNMDTALQDSPDHVERILAQMYGVLEHDPDILNTYTAYEKGVIDGLDYVLPCWIYDANRSEITRLQINFPTEEGYDPTQPIYEYHTDDAWYALAKDKGHFVWGPPYQDDGGTNQYIVSAVSPIYYDQQFAGVAGVDVTLEHLNEILSNVQIGESGYAFVTGKDGVFIANPHAPELVAEGSTVFELADQTGDEDIRTVGQAMIAGETGYLEATDPTTENAIWIMYTPIESTGWSLAVVVPIAELMQDVGRLAWVVVFITLGGIAVMGAVAFGIARSVTRPLGMVTDAARAMADGNLDVEARVRSSDEVGVLGKAFNQ